MKPQTINTWLGLILSNNCSWTEHINSISDKAWARLNLMRTLKFRVSRRSLEKMYISYVRHLIEYSDSVWDNCSTESKNQLESIHIEAARVITGATKLCSIEKRFTYLGWESLNKRRNKHKRVIFYKILHGIAPTYLSDIVPPLIQDTTTYNLRNAGNIQNYRVHTNLSYTGCHVIVISSCYVVFRRIKKPLGVFSKYRW